MKKFAVAAVIVGTLAGSLLGASLPAMRTLLESVIPQQRSVEKFELDHVFPSIGRRKMLVNARKILHPGDHDGAILLAIEDVSDERAAQAELNRTWLVTQSIVDTIRDPLVVLEFDMTIESFEIEDTFPGLGQRVFNLNARKISQPGNHTHRVLLVFEDITDRKQRERDALMLTNEISHRIKNNLQIIVGLIGYEAKLTEGAVRQGYKAMQTRISAIAELYDLISHSSRGGTITADAYLREIAKTMTATLLGESSNIQIEVDSESLDVDPDRAVPFGLLVNELVTNAIKHAFPIGVGRVVLSVKQEGSSVALTITDNGVGMKDRSVTKAPERRGFDYVNIFVRQLGGTIVPLSTDGAGTTVKVLLPRLAAEKPRATAA